MLLGLEAVGGELAQWGARCRAPLPPGSERYFEEAVVTRGVAHADTLSSQGVRTFQQTPCMLRKR